MPDWVKAALLTKTRNLEGSLVARNADGLPFLLQVGLEVHFVPPTLRGPRTATVTEINPLDATSYEVHFSGIDTIDEAEDIAGCYCLASNDEVASCVESESVDVVGMQVVDVDKGMLGVVCGIEGSAVQDVLDVEGDNGHILIPVVDAFIQDIDDEAGIITVSVPQDLIDLEGDAK